ncbi:secretion activator protein [Afipia sp. P52-10]|uniref:glycoside hydrolase family 108 protein n=1 Tax=Afipia sp. P52-10 TaxID=1429916 RepID=UPI0003DF1BD8|nr:glycosyl hydrolase 108 family protein [Afipia sp. P52-10]ETR79275.1 secretion activator protein [Afipia sp. P52-10]
MRENFDRSLKIVLTYEGGFSNHPSDPGGVTLEGIIQRVYDGYRDRVGKPRRALTPSMRGTADWIAERNAIYRAQYWQPVQGDQLPAGIDVTVFDGAVHSGPYQSVIWLQRALGMRDVDGHLGQATLAAVHAHPDHDALIADMLSRRLGMLKNLKTWPTFGKGWSNRVANLLQIGQAWAMGSVGPAPVAAHLEGGIARAYASDVALPAVDAQDALKGALGGGSITGMLTGAQTQLQPLLGTFEFIGYLYTALTVAGLVIAVAGVGYSLYAGMKAKRASRALDGDVTAAIPKESFA